MSANPNFFKICTEPAKNTPNRIWLDALQPGQVSLSSTSTMITDVRTPGSTFNAVDDLGARQSVNKLFVYLQYKELLERRLNASTMPFARAEEVSLVKRYKRTWFYPAAKKKSSIDLLCSWMNDASDINEQKESFERSVSTLDESRKDSRKLFP